MSQIIGHISQVIGPVVDVYFEGTDAELVLPRPGAAHFSKSHNYDQDINPLSISPSIRF